MSTHAGQRQEYKDRMDHHREDIEWVREECILLRAGLQELENVGARFENQLTSMYQHLCQCADHQGPPISAVGSPIPPPYPTDSSPEYHTPLIEVCPINDASTSPSSPALFPVPPTAPQSPIPLRTFLWHVVPILLPPELHYNQLKRLLVMPKTPMMWQKGWRIRLGKRPPFSSQVEATKAEGLIIEQYVF